MARKLYIFDSFTPNAENGIFYAFYSAELFWKYAKDNYSYNVVELNNYRINANVIKVKYDENIYGETFVNNKSYIIDADIVETEEETIVNYFRCYFVDSYFLQSDYIAFNVHIDLWGTYSHDALIDNTLITRCNRNIGVGIYDDIKATNGNLEHTEAWHQTDAYWGGIFDTSVCIVFLLQYNVAQAVFGNDKISKTEMFCIKLSELKEKAVALKDEFDNYSSAEIAVDIIGGIYAVTANMGTNDAQVIKAWLCDYNYIDTGRDMSLEHGVTAKSKSIFTNGSDMTFDITHVYPSKKYKEITIENYDVNKVYYAGTFNNGLKLQRYTTPNLTYCTYYIVGDDDIQVIVQQGENQKDISKAYEVLLTTNSATQTGIRRLARAVSGSMKAYTSAMKAYASGGASGALLSGTETLAGMVDMTVDFESAIGGGDGFTTFYQEQYRVFTKGQLLTPYILTTFTSTLDEKQNAIRYGALFKVWVPSKQISTMLDYVNVNNLLGADNDFNYTYIACQCSISGVPMEACNYIKNMLKNGVYLYH